MNSKRKRVIFIFSNAKKNGMLFFLTSIHYLIHFIDEAKMYSLDLKKND